MTHLDLFLSLLWRRYIFRVVGEREDSPAERINDEVDQRKCAVIIYSQPLLSR
jgi:hypothetical protein